MSPSTQGQGRPPGGPRPGQQYNRQPVRRPLPAEVYRRRRIVLLLGTVMVVVLFVVGISLLVGGLKKHETVTAGGAATPTEEATQAASPTATAPGPDGQQASGQCNANDVVVTAETDKKSYTAGATMKLTMTVKNNGGESCNISAGPKQQEFIVKQGDTIEWSSKYCQSGNETDADVQFAAGSSKPSKLTWDMVPADKTCKPTADTLKAGTYQLVTKLGDKSSDPVDFEVKDKNKEAKQA